MYVAYYSEADPASLVISERDNPKWRRPRDTHKVRGWGKLMLPVESKLVWEGNLHGVIARAGVGGLARRRASWRMPPMID